MGRSPATGSNGAGEGASSRTTCAFVPLKPNELTPAARGAGSARPRRGPGRHGKGKPCPVDERIALFEMQVRRNLLVLERQHDLDEARDARGRFEVSDVGLHRSHEQRIVSRSPFPEDGTERSDLDRIAERRARSVRLDVMDRLRLETRLCQRVANHGFLGRSVRHRQPAAAAVLVDRAAADHRHDAIAVGERVGQPLQHDHRRSPRCGRSHPPRRRRSCSGRRRPSCGPWRS